MKRMLVWVLALAAVFALSGCQSEKAARKEIFGLVENNYDEIVRACEDEETEALLAIEGIEKTKLHAGYVVVYCAGAGIAPSSQDYGFYYSEDGLPAAIDCNLSILCNDGKLTPKENGYQYVDAGHNVFYTERIRGKIYFYSTAY